MVRDVAHFTEKTTQSQKPMEEIGKEII